MQKTLSCLKTRSRLMQMHLFSESIYRWSDCVIVLKRQNHIYSICLWINDTSKGGSQTAVNFLPMFGHLPASLHLMTSSPTMWRLFGGTEVITKDTCEMWKHFVSYRLRSTTSGLRHQQPRVMFQGPDGAQFALECKNALWS